MGQKFAAMSIRGSSYKRLAERQGSVAPPRASRAGSASEGHGMLRRDGEAFIID